MWLFSVKEGAGSQGVRWIATAALRDWVWGKPSASEQREPPASEMSAQAEQIQAVSLDATTASTSDDAAAATVSAIAADDSRVPVEDHHQGDPAESVAAAAASVVVSASAGASMHPQFPPCKARHTYAVGYHTGRALCIPTPSLYK